ncbi:hypothetical protein AVEN_220648-1 [Araneus ventricosus]|uniref:Uncharacterized protein n=1 Tax=Araneus ventricosus TaxID=182803 RepID=A0A4Y2BA37_ARAVE|nr:hypothetical protein AVEN_220648-1 [Araneus ventricosus]
MTQHLTNVPRFGCLFSYLHAPPHVDPMPANANGQNHPIPKEYDMQQKESAKEYMNDVKYFPIHVVQRHQTSESSSRFSRSCEIIAKARGRFRKQQRDSLPRPSRERPYAMEKPIEQDNLKNEVHGISAFQCPRLPKQMVTFRQCNDTRNALYRFGILNFGRQFLHVVVYVSRPDTKRKMKSKRKQQQYDWYPLVVVVVQNGKSGIFRSIQIRSGAVDVTFRVQKCLSNVLSVQVTVDGVTHDLSSHAESETK